MQLTPETIEYIKGKLELFNDILKNDSDISLEYAIQILSYDLDMSDLIKDGVL